ncbi:collagenase [Porphyromonas gingivicanis]|uniref:Collagenase n=1 Tax=Porphyromonas gingivicanis TaxID=266762 RepID=A0A0A2G702_9PORP|nr:peptidase U32 family protein [Porphyromonas gingivicanis]KGN98160.1 collagenase [Porphyromonas gingivicanis]
MEIKRNRDLSLQDFEIMAPAGSYESLMAAINAGANSIYFGVEGLNMRSKSSYNFTEKDLFQIAEICRERGVKSYLTINTIIYDGDIEYMQQLIRAAAEAKVSAIIAADVAAMSYARSLGVEVHLSTQLNISNTAALEFYAQFADVVVLARELNLDQVNAIHRAIEEKPIVGPAGSPIRIEMFVHGALCMAVSGKCYLSLHELNKSANRGSCSQICRRSYKVFDTTSNIELEVENANIMSPKDLKTIHFLNKMVDAGVRVFKIEGRARGPEYVDTVVRCYREALEAVLDGTFNEERIKTWDERLATVFNRGFWDGYYLGKRLGEWTPIYGSAATQQKVYKAKVTNYFSKLGVAELELEAGSIKVGDELLITGPTTGLVRTIVQEIRYDLNPVEVGEKGWRVSVAVPSRVRNGDKVYVFETRKDIQETF